MAPVNTCRRAKAAPAPTRAASGSRKARRPQGLCRLGPPTPVKAGFPKGCAVLDSGGGDTLAGGGPAGGWLTGAGVAAAVICPAGGGVNEAAGGDEATAPDPEEK